MMANRNATSAADPRTHAFYKEIIALSHHPATYTAPGLLDLALEAIDLEKIYSVADAMAEEDASLGHQDHLIKSLLKWFKEDFFTWVDAPKCNQCDAPTTGIGASNPTAQERGDGAGRVEVYRCTSTSSHLTRFPRYNSPRTLLTFRKGRCGEWANCFTMLCLALGSSARWIWNAEDHVWTEVYSSRLQRWVHCDACENAWDEPLVYSVGWGKKMSYCFAFSSEGMQDVTRRYVREQSRALPRAKGPEAVIKLAIRDVNERCRATLTQDERDVLQRQVEAEGVELAGYKVDVEPTKVGEIRPRESGNAAWKHERGEDGTSG